MLPKPFPIFLWGGCWHGLLDELDVVVVCEPLDLCKSLFLGGPTLVCIDANWFAQGCFANGFHDFLIARSSELYLEDRVFLRLAGLAHDCFAAVQTDAEGSDVLALCERQAQKLVQRFARDSG